MADDHLRGLNAKQRSAVAYGISSGNTKSGPLLILAGAGTGKTRTLAARVAHLLTHNADPHKLLILSFGRQAARDIGRRAKQASRSVRPEVRLAWVGTFHYAAARLLRRYASHVGLSSSFTIIDKIDAEAVMELARSHVIASVQRSRVPDKRVCLQILARKVARAESLKQTLRHFPKWQEFRPTIHRVLKTFAAIKQMRNVVDFDDLLVFWRELLKMEIVGLEIRKRFTHVLVDEYQDTNRLQAEIIRLLKPDGVGVTVVGDDAQSIYGFRHAAVTNITDFVTGFRSKAKVIKLNRNYRSTQPLLVASNAIIRGANGLLKKDLWSRRLSKRKPSLVSVADEYAQAHYIVEQIENAQKRGESLADQAVLFREASHSFELEAELTKRKITFKKFGGQKFTQLKAVKDIICILRWLGNSRDDAAAARTLMLLPGIGEANAHRMISAMSGQIDKKALRKAVCPARARGKWSKLIGALTYAKQAEWSDSSPAIIQWYLAEVVSKRSFAIVAAQMAQLSTMANRYRSGRRFTEQLILDQPDRLGDTGAFSGQHVTLSTIHSAKGKEWSAVRVLNVVDGFIPSSKAESVEEERRLLYVAMTRAKNVLELIVPKQISRGFHVAGSEQHHLNLQRSALISKKVSPCFDFKSIKIIRP